MNPCRVPGAARGVQGTWVHQQPLVAGASSLLLLSSCSTCLVCATQIEQQVRDHQQLRLCLSLDASLRVHPPPSLPPFPFFSPLPDGPVLLHRRPEGRDPLPPLRPERALLHPLHLAHPPLRRCPRAPSALRLARWVPRCSGCCRGRRGLPPHSQGSWVPASPTHGCRVLGVCVQPGSSLAQGCPRQAGT